MSNPLGAITSQGTTRAVEHVHPFAVAPAALWPHLTVPDRIVPWMRTTSLILEPAVGGNVHFVWGDAGDMRGTVMIFDVPDRLAFAWHEGTDHSSVRFDLSADGDGTSLRCRHRDLTPDRAASIAAGWHTHLELLAALLADEQFDFDQRYDELLPRYQEMAAAL